MILSQLDDLHQLHLHCIQHCISYISLHHLHHIYIYIYLQHIHPLHHLYQLHLHHMHHQHQPQQLYQDHRHQLHQHHTPLPQINPKWLLEHQDPRQETSKSHYSWKHDVRKQSRNDAFFWCTHRLERVTFQSAALVSSHDALFLGCVLKWWLTWCSEVMNFWLCSKVMVFMVFWRDPFTMWVGWAKARPLASWRQCVRGAQIAGESDFQMYPLHPFTLWSFNNSLQCLKRPRK